MLSKDFKDFIELLNVHSSQIKLGLCPGEPKRSGPIQRDGKPQMVG